MNACANPKCKHHALQVPDDAKDFKVISSPQQFLLFGRPKYKPIRRIEWRSPFNTSYYLCEVCSEKRR